MQKYEIIEKAIAQNDIETLREAVGNLCYTSRDFSSGEFDEVVRYIESKGINLKDDTLIGPPTISSQKNAFSDEDFSRAVFELKKNFCDERIQDAKKIGRALYGVNSKKEDIIHGTSSEKTEEGRSLENAENPDPNLKSHSQRMLKIIILCVVAILIIIIVLKSLGII